MSDTIDPALETQNYKDQALASHPGTPTKKPQHRCLSCHTTASYLVPCPGEHGQLVRWYCPDCQSVHTIVDGRVYLGTPPGTLVPAEQITHVGGMTLKEYQEQQRAERLARLPRCISCDKITNRKNANGQWQCPECWGSVIERAKELVAPQQEIIGGMAHSVGTPPYHLIPAVALEELAVQYGLGEKMKGKLAWNAMAADQRCLLRPEALAARLGHVISHTLAMLKDIAAGDVPDVRDAAAIMWGGSFAVTSVRACNDAAAQKSILRPAYDQLAGVSTASQSGTDQERTVGDQGSAASGQ